MSSNPQNSSLNVFLDDLNAQQLTQLLHWLNLIKGPVTRASIKEWRKRQNLPIDD